MDFSEQYHIEGLDSDAMRNRFRANVSTIVRLSCICQSQVASIHVQSYVKGNQR